MSATHPPSSRFPLVEQLGLKVEHNSQMKDYVQVVRATDLESLLSSGVRVYGGPFCLGGQWSFTEKQAREIDTHTCLAIDIRPIERAPRKRELSEPEVRKALDEASGEWNSEMEKIISKLFGPRTEGSADE